MNSNIKKFDSKEAFDAYRATDGWAYPSVNYITNNEESSIHYNNEFIMEWNENDTIKAPAFYGDVSHDEFKAWVDKCAKPCEIKKDGTDFAYIKRVSDSSSEVDDWTLRHGTNAGSSHYSDTDNGTSDYFQMVELQNINVGLFKDTKKGTKQIRFNFDKGCPDGFHKWFPNSTDGTKLFGRYDIAPTVSTSTAGTNGIEVCFGSSQGTYLNTTSGLTNGYSKGNWNSEKLLEGINHVNAGLDSSVSGKYQFMEETYWEHLVMSYIFCAYFKTFDTQSVYRGLDLGYTDGNAGQWSAGTVDNSVKTHLGSTHGTPGSNTSPYKFLHIENALHGKQWIWGAGWWGNNGKYYMTFDDKKANLACNLAIANADITGTYATNWSQTYITDIDLYGVPEDTTGATGESTQYTGSSSRGFFDACWSNTGASQVAYLGGGSDLGARVGAFARAFSNDASSAYWSRRGRITMNK